MTGISADDQKHLRRPFTVAAVKFRAASKPTSSGKVMCLSYIDARLAVERVSEVDSNYRSKIEFAATGASDGIGASVNTPVICRLEINGVVREDVGLHATSRADDMYAKSAVSDAFKRAASQFGVGAYLYALGDAWIDSDGYKVGSDGKVKWLTREGDAQLRRWYAGRIGNAAFVARFGDPIDYGDRLPSEEEFVQIPDPVVIAGMVAIVEEKAAPEEATPLDVNLIATIGEIAVLSGGERATAIRWANERKNKQLALKRTVERAIGRTDRESILGALKQNGLESFIEAFDAEVVV